jgi:hypothetical protein
VRVFRFAFRGESVRRRQVFSKLRCCASKLDKKSIPESNITLL